MAFISRINSPSQPERESKSDIQECKFALEPSLARLVEMAAEAGWKRQQIAVALALFADDVFEDGNLKSLQ